MGGGAMRTAAKAAALGGYRSAVSRSAGRSPSASVSVHQDPIFHPLSSGTEAPVLPAAPAEKPSCDTDVWEFVGGNEEALFDTIHPSPRFIFGPPPTFQEAKEATGDLKDALQMVYSSSSITDVHVSEQGPLCFEKSEEKDPITSAIMPPIPKHVAQAFSLIQDNPEAQDVVAALVSDPNIWKAFVNNPKVKDFYENYQHEDSTADNADSQEETSKPKENYQHEYSTADDATNGSNSSSKADSEEPTENIFIRFMKKIKATASQWVNRLSDLFQDILDPPKNAAAEKGGDVGVAASFIGLAIAAILIVLIKRGV